MLQESKLVAIARGVAMGIFPIEAILKSEDVTPREFEEMQRLPRFQTLVEQIASEFGSTANTAERIRVKSQAIIEDVLPDIYSRMTDKRESFAAQVDALKTIRLMAGIGGEKGENQAPERFSLEIHIGDAKPKIIDMGPAREITPGVKVINDELGGGIE